MWRLVWKEVFAATLRLDVICANVGTAVSRQTFRIAGWRKHTIEVNVGLSRDQVSGAFVANLKPVDFLEPARPVREEALARLRLGGIGEPTPSCGGGGAAQD